MILFSLYKACVSFTRNCLCFLYKCMHYSSESRLNCLSWHERGMLSPSIHLQHNKRLAFLFLIREWNGEKSGPFLLLFSCSILLLLNWMNALILAVHFILLLTLMVSYIELALANGMNYKITRERDSSGRGSMSGMHPKSKQIVFVVRLTVTMPLILH